jgi:hypothetical protein
MYEYEHTVQADAAPAAVWALYADVAGWPRWDTSVVSMVLEGPFATGTRATMTIEGMPPISSVLADVEDERSFTDLSSVPEFGIEVRFEHHLAPRADGGTTLTNRVVVTGPGAGKAGPMITGDVPETMRRLADLASTVGRG